MNLKHLQMRHSKLSSTLFHTFFFFFFIGFSKTNYFLQSWIHVVTKHWCEMNNLHCSKVRNTHWQIVSVNKDVISCDIHSVPGQSQTELVCCWCVRSWCKKKDGDVTRAGMCGTSYENLLEIYKEASFEWDNHWCWCLMIPFNKAVRMAISISCCPSDPIRKTVIYMWE